MASPGRGFSAGIKRHMLSSSAWIAPVVCKDIRNEEAERSAGALSIQREEGGRGYCFRSDVAILNAKQITLKDDRYR